MKEKIKINFKAEKKEASKEELTSKQEKTREVIENLTPEQDRKDTSKEKLVTEQDRKDNSKEVKKLTPEQKNNQLEQKFNQLKKKIDQLEQENKLLKLKKDFFKERTRVLQEKFDEDELTGLATRTLFKKTVESYIKNIESEEKRENYSSYKTFSILFFDIDNFKKINDTYGHGFGDTILREVAQTLQSNIRDLDRAARWGGEEMAVALLGANEERATTKAEEIRKSIAIISKKYINEHPDFKVTASVGVKEYTKHLKISDMIDDADKAMYVAKTTGKNRVVPYSKIEEINKETGREL